MFYRTEENGYFSANIYGREISGRVMLPPIGYTPLKVQ